jgi:hypothetical protein
MDDFMDEMSHQNQMRGLNSPGMMKVNVGSQRTTITHAFFKAFDHIKSPGDLIQL